jgi:ABC-2 type transport system permease protein
MTGFGPFLVKELREISATWKLFVLPLMLLLCAVSSPLLALATPYLVSTVANLPLKLPDPTVADAYAQWAKNLGQLPLLVVIVSFSSAVNGERASGTAAMALSKGLTPAAFVVAKVAAAFVLVAVPTALATVVMAITTRAVFGDAPWGTLLRATAAWLVLALWCVTAVVLLSTVLDSTSATAGLAIAAWVVLAVVSSWGPAARWSPAGLVGAPSSLAMGLDTVWLWPMLTAAVTAAMLVVGSVLALRRREL